MHFFRPVFAMGLILALTTCAFGQAWAATGLPLPRYVSLRASEVNVRTGPGVRYPVDWVFRRHGLPVEIVAEFDTWRKIRDAEGTEGWVHQSLLSGKRTILVTGGMRTLYRKPAANAKAVAKAEANVVGTLLACPKDSEWCRVSVGAYEGWLKRSDFWGVYSNEVIE
ncbi:MAG: SH3 domain-containing protein [Alphaproteobacteria bacterium]